MTKQTGDGRTTQLRAALYARISPVSDREPDNNYSIRSQLRPMRERVKKEGWFSCPELEFVDEHISGKDLNRPALKRLRDLIHRREINVLLVYSDDRLARTAVDLLLIEAECRRYKVRLVFIASSEFADTPEGKMLLAIKGAVSEFERRKIVERTSRCRKEKAQNNEVTNHTPPYGYAYQRKQKKESAAWVRHEQEIPGLKMIFKMLAQGKSLRSTSRALEAAGLMPRKAAHWHPNVIRDIIRNPAYLGKAHMNYWQSTESKVQRHPDSRHVTQIVRPEEEWVWVDVPALVTPELWKAANDNLERNRKALVGQPSRQYLLVGYLWCGYCGKRCCSIPNHGKPYYRCNNVVRSTGERRCRSYKTVRSALADDVVWTAVIEYLTDPVRLEAALRECRQPNEQSQDRARQLRAEIDDQQTIEFRATQKILDPRFKDNPKPWEDACLAAKERRRELEKELRMLAPRPEDMSDVNLRDLATVTRLYQKYKDRFDFATRRATIEDVVDKIRYYSDEREIEVDMAIPVEAGPCRNRQEQISDVDETYRPVISFTIKRKLVA